MPEKDEQIDRFIVRLEGEKAYIYDAITHDEKKINRADYKAIAEYTKQKGVEPTVILHAIMKASSTIAEYGTHEDLYLEIRNFIEKHLDLVEDAEFDVLTAKVLESWLIDRFNTVGYLFFIGPPKSGKTRAIDVLSSICYNSISSATMTAPAIYRTLDKGTATLFFDEIQQYIKEDKATFLAILNAGYRRGQKATIVIKTRDGYEAKGFEVFGSKVLAATDLPTEALSTHCVMIPMVKNSRKVSFRIDREKTKQLKHKLARFKEDWKDKEIPDLEDVFLKNGFTDYRNVEIFINLAAVTPEKHRDRIINYAREIDDQIAEEDGINFYANLFKAIEKVLPTMKGGKISINDIAEAYNEDLPESEQLSNKTIGKHVIVMGLKNKCRMSNGTAGRKINEKILERLRKRYAPPQTKLDYENDVSEETEDTYVSNVFNIPVNNSESIHTTSPSETSETSVFQSLGDTLPVLQEAFRQIEENSTENWVATIINFMMCDESYAEKAFKHLVDEGLFTQVSNGDWRYIHP